MWFISRLRDQRYCAFCKAKRRIYTKKHVDLTNVACAIAFSLAATYAVWAAPDPRGFVFFGLSIIGAEIFVYMRWRMTIVCKMCGFDPVVYKRSPEQAALRVKQFFKEQVENPQFMLTKSPLLKVQKQIRTNEKKALEMEQFLNRTKASSLASPKSL
jgi:hypothetical protein